MRGDRIEVYVDCGDVMMWCKVKREVVVRWEAVGGGGRRCSTICEVGGGGSIVEGRDAK